MSNDLAVSAMWLDASTDHDAEEHRRQVVGAKVALSGAWPFLAAAHSAEDFEHRLALMREQIEDSTPADALGDVVASLRQDWEVLAAERLHEAQLARDAALTVTAASFPDEALPSAYVHVQRRGEGDDGYWQVDAIHSPEHVQTLARTASRDEAYQHAAQGVPIFENGAYVSGYALAKVAADEEYLDASTGQWFRRVGGYQPDPQAGWRYHYPPTPPSSDYGGSPAGPGQHQNDPNGFPLDLAVGEQSTPEAYARQTTPGPWTVTPGTEWPADSLPNAATGLPQGQVPDGNPATAGVENTAYGRTGSAHTSKDYGPGEPIPTPFLSVYHNQAKHRHQVDLIHSPSMVQTLHRAYSPDEALAVAQSYSDQNGVPVYQHGKHLHGPQHTAAKTAAEIDDHVTKYVSWAKKNGHDPDSVKALKTYEKQPGISRQHTDAIADQLYVGGGEKDWRRNSSIHQAQEGVAPSTHAPNPNYFSQGTEGLAGPPTFPVDPAAEPTPPDQINPMVDVYGGVPPEHSSGSATTGTQDGGYSRMGAAQPRKAEPRQAAPHLDRPRHAMNGSNGTPGIVRESEYHYIRKNGDKYEIWQKGTGKTLSTHDSEGDAIASFKAMMQSKHSGARSPDFPQSARERTAASGLTPGEAGPHYRDPQFRPKIGPEGEDSDCNCHTDRVERTVTVNPLCPEHGHYAKEAARARTGRWEPDENDPRTHRSRGFYDAQHKRPYAGEEHQDQPHSRAYREGWDSWHDNYGPKLNVPERHDDGTTPESGPYHEVTGHRRTSTTNGQIVGHCDHCRHPVRWHDGDGESQDGHLEHLHNSSHKCNDGASTTTTARTATVHGLTVLPQFFDPHTAVGDNSGFGATSPGGAMPNDPGMAASGPSGAGMDPGMATGGGIDDSNVPQGNAMDLSSVSSANVAYYRNNLTHTSLQTITAPTPENPSGKDPDEFRANTWEGLIKQRPMQSAEDRHVNTPTLPQERHKTRNINTPTPGLHDENEDSIQSEDDDEDEEN